ncbi:hypothetical protein TTHERM_00189540 (macronuclear) [Tetrahymena thermophila SB210]|uniref:Uncharacterized protein n=1 Tax=Tetrahymena thermophila (strain SB210) TaxID=312017 RepID=I7MJI3_TETTS|nr:hypothetical protein TTHERM_00189540 [Tetrahymena thermophila SB210]EAR96385.2 hypothetical protein TTHERM_00189540 [Tetrahymena thermophila SB210]|eukprot:XP_001016630.2 hypothetical protein TTHERM_00189540 [Tetrahymena thermophila SB210]
MSGITQLKQNCPQLNQGILPNQSYNNPGRLVLFNNYSQINNVQTQQLMKIPTQQPYQVQTNQIRQVQYGIPQFKNKSIEQTALPQRLYYQIHQCQQTPQQVQKIQYITQKCQPIQQNYSQNPHQRQQLQYQQQQIQSQFTSDKVSTNFQPILPQQTVDYSKIANLQYNTISPFVGSVKSSSPLRIHQIEKLTQPTTANTEMTYRGTIQEIKPLNISSYGAIQCQEILKGDGNQTDRNNQIVCHTFQNEIQNNDSFLNQINNNDALNVSFSKDKNNNVKESAGDLESIRKSYQNSHNNSFLLSNLQNAPLISSPQKQINFTPSSVKNSPAVKINHFLPNLTLINNLNEQSNHYPTHQRSKSAWSPLKQNKEFYLKSEEFQFCTPMKQMNSDQVLDIKNSTPKQVDFKENQCYSQQGIAFSPIIGKVSLQYISKNNPQPHFNDQPSQFHKTPERSKDAVSCVFFNYGEKKRPTKIKLKYTPIEQILTPDQLQEYQTKHQDLNLIQNKPESQINISSEVTPLKENNYQEQKKQQQIVSLNNYCESYVSTSQVNTESNLNDQRTNKNNNSSNKFQSCLYANELVSSVYS